MCKTLLASLTKKGKVEVVGTSFMPLMPETVGTRYAASSNEQGPPPAMPAGKNATRNRQKKLNARK